MKSHIAIGIFLGLGVHCLCPAQDYYYYDGQKIPLEINKKKIGVFFPAENNTIDFHSIFPASTEERSVKNPLYHGAVLDLENMDVESGEEARELLINRLTNAGKSEYLTLPVYTTAQGQEVALTNLLKVRLRKSEDKVLLEEAMEEFRLTIVDSSEWMPLWYVLSVTRNTNMTSLEAANKLYESGLFKSASPEFSFDALECVPDPEFGRQWGLDNASYPGIDISACQAWSLAKGDGIVIAIVDYGIDLTHQDLKANIAPFSYDVPSESSPSKLYGNHGTHCAGIAGAVSNNIQVVGVAPDAQLMSISLPMQSAMDFAKGISVAWQNGADILSCSWRSPEDDAIKDAIDQALLNGREGKGCVFVKSAGNQGGGAVTFPGNYREEVLTVSSIAKNGSISSFSSIGSAVDVCAPGSAILSTLPGDQIGEMQGTSMACPHVAGIAALILSANPYLTGQEVRDIIERTAKKIGTLQYNQTASRPNGTWNSSYGYGLVNAYEAVQTACANVKVQNEVISEDRTVKSCGDLLFENVTIKKGAKLTIEATGNVTFGNGFSLEEGAELQMD